jgi:hypothetical protein
MKRRALIVPCLVLALACGCGLEPSSGKLPDPSRHRANSISYQACRTAVERYGADRVARRLDASGTGPHAIASAFVRRALRRTNGWRPFRRVALSACARGVRDATA